MKLVWSAIRTVLFARRCASAGWGGAHSAFGDVGKASVLKGAGQMPGDGGACNVDREDPLSKLPETEW